MLISLNWGHYYGGLTRPNKIRKIWVIVQPMYSVSILSHPFSLLVPETSVRSDPHVGSRSCVTDTPECVTWRDSK